MGKAGHEGRTGRPAPFECSEGNRVEGEMRLVRIRSPRDGQALPKAATRER